MDGVGEIPFLEIWLYAQLEALDWKFLIRLFAALDRERDRVAAEKKGSAHTSAGKEEA